MAKKIKLIITAIISAATAACATPQTSVEEAKEVSAYGQCLEENMAVAMAWSAIEEQCRKKVSADKDPLDLRHTD